MKQDPVRVSGHGHARGGVVTPEYRAWQAAKSRCTNPKDARWKWYGALGVTMCDRWRGSFQAFLADVGPRPSPAHSLDRFPNNAGHYEPGNVRWATPIEQGRNLRTTRRFELDGETKTLGEWVEIFGAGLELTQQRLRKGWSLREALTTASDGSAPTVSTKPERKRAYLVWYMMIDRCVNPANNSFKDYGARGITVCDRWRSSFDDFLSDVGERPSPQHSLDRINGAKGYEPGNVQWSLRKQQARNRRNTKLLELFGQTRPMAEWAELAGHSYDTIKKRVGIYGWSLDEALGTPVVGTGRMLASARRRWSETSEGRAVLFAPVS